MFAFLLLGGCAGRNSVQNNPSAHQKIVFASAYSVEDCQAKMNDLAKSEVRMIDSNQRVVTSIFSFGIVPSHECIGIAKETADQAALPPEHE